MVEASFDRTMLPIPKCVYNDLKSPKLVARENPSIPALHNGNISATTTKKKPTQYRKPLIKDLFKL